MRLSLAEGLLLIALDDEEGRLLSDAEKGIVKALVAAALFELCLLKKLSFDGGKVTAVDTSSAGNKVLDQVMAAVGGGGQSVLATTNGIAESLKAGIYDLCIDLLIGRGILKREATRLLWIPISERMDNANYSFEKEIRDSLKAIVLKGVKPTPAFIVLAVLMASLEILDEVFRDKDQLIDAIKFAKDSIKSGGLSPDMAHALEAVREDIASI